MRVSTRIISGAGILMILALLAIGHLSLIHSIRRVTSDLAISFHAAEAAETLIDDAELVDSLSQSFLVSSGEYITRDGIRRLPADDLTKAWQQFEEDFTRLRAGLGANRATEDVRFLEQRWQDYRKQWDAVIGSNPEGKGQHLAKDLIRPVVYQAQILSQTINSSLSADVERATTNVANIERVSWVAAPIALIIGVVSIFLLRTINDSLRRLMRGTRMIAQGQFWHRLRADGRDEFSELAADFNSMSERLGQLDNMKKDFVSHVSHELKAPLASVRQTFHVLLEQIPGPLNDQQKRLLRLSNNSAERLTAMVGNLLDVSRMEAGNMEYTLAPVDLLSLARNVAEEFEIQAGEKGVSIRVERASDSASMVECDRDRMVQVIGNLFDNALKFSPRGGDILATIQERAAGSSRAGGSGSDRLLVFSVRDGGIGVPDEHKSRIFRKFHQVKQGKKMSGQGVGLGLAICSSIIEAHRGRIWVEDHPDGGSVFCFELPAMARAEATTA